jgi:signal transduction histidine kinase
MDNSTLQSTDVIIFVASGLLVICLMFGFILYFLMSYRQKRKDYILLESQKKEIDRQKVILETTLLELKQTQAQLIQSEKMASLGELVAGISHEIQNPLNFVTNFATLNQELMAELKEEIQKNNYEEVLAIIEDIIGNEKKIRDHGKRAEGIIKSMLEHSRSGKGQKEMVDINVMCEEYIKVAKEENTMKLEGFSGTYECILSPETGKTELMKQDIGRVFLNLINNAFYAAHQRWLSVHSTDPAFIPKVTIKTIRHPGEIEIYISDNGTGIPESEKNKIFQPFFTTKPSGKGTGLGLSLASDIIRAHGGSITVESEENVGSEFLIKLPVKK